MENVSKVSSAGAPVVGLVFEGTLAGASIVSYVEARELTSPKGKFSIPAHYEQSAVALLDGVTYALTIEHPAQFPAFTAGNTIRLRVRRADLSGRDIVKLTLVYA